MEIPDLKTMTNVVTNISPKFRGPLEVEIIAMFPQLWGSTALGFDEDENHEPTFGGQAMTKAYTTVIRESRNMSYFVFFGSKIAYRVTDAPKVFFEDIQNHNMASLSQARKRYE